MVQCVWCLVDECLLGAEVTFGKMLECKLIGLVVRAARATAYVGNGAPLPIVDLEVAGRLEVSSEIAAMIFWAVLSFLDWSLLAASNNVVVEHLMLLTRFSSLLIMGQKVPLVPIRRSLIMVKVLDVIALSDRSVSRIEIEWIASSSVFGIFWASVMWSNVVARVEKVMGC